MLEVVGIVLLVAVLVAFFGMMAYVTIGILLQPVADWLKSAGSAAERAAAWFRRHGV